MEPPDANLNGTSQHKVTKHIGSYIRIRQLNIEGISRAKGESLSKILNENKIDVVAIQETHTSAEERFLDIA